MRKHLIFDFDGTLADTFDLVVEGVNVLALKYGYAPIQDDEIQGLKEKTLPELLRQHGVSLRMTPFLSLLIKNYIKKHVDRIRLLPGIEQFVLTLQKEGRSLGIVSSNCVSTIDYVLTKYGVRSCFSFVHSTRSLFGKHRTLRQYCRRHDMSAQDCVYIADEVRDVKSCERIQFPYISVARGYNTKELLEKEGAKKIVDSPDELYLLLGKNTYV